MSGPIIIIKRKIVTAIETSTAIRQNKTPSVRKFTPSPKITAMDMLGLAEKRSLSGMNIDESIRMPEKERPQTNHFLEYWLKINEKAHNNASNDACIKMR
jgi:hypothetical protein